MADINVHRVHTLGLKAARTAADKMAARLEEKFELTGDWKGNLFQFSRSGVNGTLAVSETDLKLEITLGFLLKMMKAPIEKAVNEQLDIALTAKGAATKTPANAAPSKPAPKKK